MNDGDQVHIFRNNDGGFLHGKRTTRNRNSEVSLPPQLPANLGCCLVLMTNLHTGLPRGLEPQLALCVLSGQGKGASTLNN